MTISGKQVELAMQRLGVSKEKMAELMEMDVVDFQYLLNTGFTPIRTKEVLNALVRVKHENSLVEEALSFEDGLLSFIMYFNFVPYSDIRLNMNDCIKILNWLSELEMYRKIGLLSEVEKVRNNNENLDNGKERSDSDY